MNDRREGPRFVADSSGNVRDVRQNRYAPTQLPPSGPPWNGRDSRSGPRPPKKSAATPYLVPIPIGLIIWLVITLIRGLQPETRPAPFPSPFDFSDFGLGSQAYFLGEYDAAIMHLTKALDSYTPVGEVYNRRGLAYQAKGEHEKALQDFEQALSLYSNPAMVYNNRAITYLAMRDLDKAMADLDKAIELQPSLGKAYYNRALVSSSLGDYDAAIADLSEALKFPASESSSPFSRLSALRRTGSGDDLVEAYEKEREFLETRVDAPSALYRRALAYQAKGLSGSALADLDKAIDLLSQRSATPTPLSSVRESAPSGEMQEAPDEKGRAVDPWVDLPSVYYLRALVYVEQGEYDDAAADLDEAVNLGLDRGVGQRLRAFLTTLGAGSSARGDSEPAYAPTEAEEPEGNR